MFTIDYKRKEKILSLEIVKKLTAEKEIALENPFLVSSISTALPLCFSSSTLKYTNL